MWGGMVVAFPFVFFIEYLRSNLTEMPGLHMVIYGALMILLMIFYPSGLAGMYESVSGKVRSVLRARAFVGEPQVQAPGTTRADVAQE